MPKLVNRAKMTTATAGTGTITLGSASSGYQSFADAGVSDGDLVRYVIEDGTAWEIGEGTYTASGTTLTRTVLESSNSDNAINLSGSATVFVDAVAQDIARPTVGRVAAGVYIVPMTASTNAAAASSNTLYVVPVMVPFAGEYTRIGIEVTTAVSGNARLGIYKHDPARNWPGALVLDAGTVSTGTTGQKEITISQRLMPGWCWLAMVSDNGFSFRSAQAILSIGVTAPNTPIVRLTRSFTYAALPADESAQTYTLAALHSPYLWIGG